MKLQFANQAIDDLIRLRQFIAEKNPAAAERISEQLVASIYSLVDQPEMGHPLEALSEVREWVARDYVVHYLVLDETLTVLQIWHGKESRDMDS